MNHTESKNGIKHARNSTAQKKEHIKQQNALEWFSWHFLHRFSKRHCLRYSSLNRGIRKFLESNKVAETMFRLRSSNYQATDLFKIQIT